MTTFLAIWGAIVSTALALWTFYKDIRDRAKVLVEAGLSESTEINKATNKEINTYQLEVVLTNIGRRSVNIVSVGVGNTTPSSVFWGRFPLSIWLNRAPPGGFLEVMLESKGSLPTRLDVGDFISLKAHSLFFAKDPKYCSLFAIDSFKRYYFLPEPVWDQIRRYLR